MKRFISILLMSTLVLAGCARPVPMDSENTPSGTVLEETEPSATPAPEPTPAPSENTERPDANTPVLIKGLLIGGLHQGEWMPYDAFYSAGIVDFDGFVYDVYVDDMLTGQAHGELPVSFLTGEPVGPEGDLSELADVMLYDGNEERVIYDIALRADWELFPREYEALNTDQPEYLTMVQDMIAVEGVEDPVTELKQVISVDLDGDGSNEMLIAADNAVDEQFSQVQKGDNALLVFRKMIDGQPVDQIVDAYIVTKDPDYITPYRLLYEVETCADLDGDGTLEVVVKSWYYEGVTYSIYKLEGDRLIRVASNGVGF